MVMLATDYKLGIHYYIENQYKNKFSVLIPRIILDILLYRLLNVV